MGGNVRNCYVSSGYGSMNSHTVYQHNGLKSFMDCNNRDDKYMNDNIQKGDVISVNCLINRHTLSQFNESGNLNDMNWGV